MSQIQDTGMEMLRTVLRRLRWDDQGGYPGYRGNGRWDFVTAGLPQVTPEERMFSTPTGTSSRPAGMVTRSAPSARTGAASGRSGRCVAAVRQEE